MKYSFYKNQKNLNTFIILDGNSHPLIRFRADMKKLIAFIVLVFLLLAWYQYAETFHEWALRKVNDYETTKTINILHKNSIASLNKTIIEHKKSFLAIQKDSQYLLNLLGINPDESTNEIKIASLAKTNIHIQKNILGDRIEKNTVFLNNQAIMEFYQDNELTTHDDISAEQRAIIAAKQLKLFLANQIIKNHITVHALNEDTMIGKLGNKFIFRVDKNDSKYSNSTVEQLAQQWANNINTEIKMISLNRKKINIKSFIAMPFHHNNQNLYKEIAQLQNKINKEKILFASIKNEVQQLTNTFAQTPSAYPLYRPITSPYGLRKHPITHRFRFHTGVDFWAFPGTRIHSTASGRVKHAGWYGGYGYIVRINHGRGLETIYAHCSKLLVHNGQWVRKGQAIALSGQSGLANGAHLHYEIRKWDKPINPIKFLNLDIMTARTLEE